MRYRYSRFLLLIAAVFFQTARGEEENPLKGLDGVQFSSSVADHAGDHRSRRIGLAAVRPKDALKKAGIWRKTEEASAYPHAHASRFTAEESKASFSSSGSCR